ncbi:hypothetical protein Tco_0890359 [Tanacetum coccineum]|uniref:Uncharacterized protein n=1 Tax=Tanacetum coccineum TaxID=301880 RepID=A0ABQ5C245_9ASTR
MASSGMSSNPYLHLDIRTRELEPKYCLRCSQDMQANSSTVVEMMKLALWWLQTDPMRRHSMSSVVKVLKGGMNAQLSLDYSFTDPRMQKI